MTLLLPWLAMSTWSDQSLSPPLKSTAPSTPAPTQAARSHRLKPRDLSVWNHGSTRWLVVRRMKQMVGRPALRWNRTERARSSSGSGPNLARRTHKRNDKRNNQFERPAPTPKLRGEQDKYRRRGRPSELDLVGDRAERQTMWGTTRDLPRRAADHVLDLPRIARWRFLSSSVG